MKPENSKKTKFCSRPFEWLEIHEGHAHFCAPDWIKDMPGVPVKNRKMRSIWNDKSVQDFRKSILDESFKYCNEKTCPFLSQKNPLPGFPSPVQYKDQIISPRLQKIIHRNLTKLNDGPFVWSCSHDKTCNLSCPSCRQNLIAASKNEITERIKLQNRVLKELKGELKTLIIATNGDAFASKVYWDLLCNLSTKKYPNLKFILYTNGTLLNENNWNKIHKIHKNITGIHISVDAATEKTYSLNRRGANWNILMENLNFVAKLRRSNLLKFVMLSFVVQKNNYQEMPLFIKLAKEFNFDSVFFERLCNWGTYSKEQFEEVSICDPKHPAHHKLQEVLKDHLFNHPIVGLGNISNIKNKL